MQTEQRPNGHQVRSDKSTKALLRAAGELIAEGGYQSMTLAQVGERAGYSRSLATARFGSKAKLLEALVDEIVVRWSVERVEPESRGLDGLSSLRVLLTEITESYARNPHSLTTLYALIFEALGPLPDLRERFVVFNRGLRTRIAAAIERGLRDGSVVAGVDPDLIATEIVAELRGVGYLWQLDPESIDPGSVLSQFIDRCVRTLSAPPAST